MTRYVVDVDLIGSTATEVVEAPTTEAAVALVAAMYSLARSVTVAGIVTAPVPAQQ